MKMEELNVNPTFCKQDSVITEVGDNSQPDDLFLCGYPAPTST